MKGAALIRKIIGFHQDEMSNWVADLECGHTQRVRRHSPEGKRPWVLMAGESQSEIELELDCTECGEEEEPPSDPHHPILHASADRHRPTWR